MTGPAPPLVLIADNDAGVGALLQGVLLRVGVASEVVPDGVAALERIADGGIALLICDLDMPRMGGLEVIEKLVESEGPPPVTVISAYLDEQLEARLGACDLVERVWRKPFDLLQFAEWVARALGAEPC